MTKYFIVLIRWDILNKGRIRKKLYTPKYCYKEESSLFIGIYYYYYYNMLLSLTLF